MKDISMVGLYERDLEMILTTNSIYVHKLIETTPILKELTNKHKENMFNVATEFFEIVDEIGLADDDEFCEVFEIFEIRELCENWFKNRYEYDFEDMIECIGNQISKVKII
ncbi:hypothetical protein J8Z28_17615 [Pseudoalteromonas sp. SCSIO 43088]|uniref:hypothetical protein n=1 Tax=Pseudoalteromonas sp. SCSIO 43088 TaxID=2822846 RepID=UPI00202AE0E0|nr:hypothetical protein [Pseudoalteromonas sp. SCSIO 43088]URQ86310.1 hypothetical protein J8Z28_17615 [Pseudoalteromonas sp. SCSIO 43088]